MTAGLVFAGAAVGAVLRYLTGLLLPRRFPWATLAVNVAGSFVLGVVAGASPAVTALVGTGFCGGLTTFSTFSWETVALVEAGRAGQALANVATSLVTGVAAAFLGYALTR
ncbi:fluoride efflux transporter CrcB [Saccharothrix syringae]|uniref:Fluoride-specific ion channel FluC n=1 Tax=Saccharothrix syringae TaxID=103733 RepID=A0A5Q0GV47_SACSY|nr:fluoride efflux transporter CrcB [Saccharothrix syringae]QFZ17350.1 fluoride efflux transporter CrcB [Saccharothrix syringae]